MQGRAAKARGVPLAANHLLTPAAGPPAAASGPRADPRQPGILLRAVDRGMRGVPRLPHRRQGRLDRLPQPLLQLADRGLHGRTVPLGARRPGLGRPAHRDRGAAQRRLVHRHMPALMRLHRAPEAAALGDLAGEADAVLGLRQAQPDPGRPGADAARCLPPTRVDLAAPFDAGGGEAEMVQPRRLRQAGRRMQRRGAGGGREHRRRVLDRERHPHRPDRTALGPRRPRQQEQPERG